MSKECFIIASEDKKLYLTQIINKANKDNILSRNKDEAKLFFTMFDAKIEKEILEDYKPETKWKIFPIK